MIEVPQRNCMLLMFYFIFFECSVISSGYIIDRIVGGRKAEADEFLYQASLQKLTAFGYAHFCGASLIAPEWLVTAAHCIKSNSTKSYRVMLGSTSLLENSEEYFHSVVKIIIKHGFDPSTFENDVALVRIYPPVENVENTIRLFENSVDSNVKAIVIGWGTTRDGGTASMDLLAAEVNVISYSDCLDYYPDGYIYETMICAAEDETDACQGDSGGPLLQRYDGISYLVGIVSWGAGCAQPDYPGVYTNVSLFNSWINHYVFP